MAIIYSYPHAVPTINDMVLGAKFREDEGISTNSFYISDIAALVEASLPEPVVDLFIKTIKVTLSSSQILNLFTTTVELVPAVPGKLLILKSIYQKYNYGTTTYSNINTCKLGYGTTALLLANFSLLAYDVANANGIFAPSLNIASTNTYAGLPIVLGATVANPTTGDGTLDLYLTYYEITL